MKTLSQSLLFAITALALAGTAYAQVPSTNDTSDGSANTGMGTGALGGVNLSGTNNTASGYEALFSNTTGTNNTASGVSALQNNTEGDANTAFGINALFSNTSGSENTASGYEALFSNTIGTNNTASGFGALFHNTSGSENTAFGINALFSNKTGLDNTASGSAALGSNTTGNDNTASGVSALVSNTTGGSNIAVGFQAGLNLTTGSNNIDIGNVGVAGESNLIRIGTKGTHKGAIIAGISTFTVTGSAVYVTNTGRLGVLASSERYKTAITPMGSNTTKLEELRPVTFHLKTDPKGALQYGLIAEEVAKVYPELVIRNENGRIDGVRYDELAPMLLNEVQKRNVAQDQHIAAQDAKISQLVGQLAEMHAALVNLQSKSELVAQQ
jgi:hypothetical protein